MSIALVLRNKRFYVFRRASRQPQLRPDVLVFYPISLWNSHVTGPA